MGTHVDLFSGIGGFALAARWAGLETVLFCDNDKYAQKVLRKHWPDVPIVEDIRELTYERYVADTERARASSIRRGGEAHGKRDNSTTERGWNDKSVVAGADRPFLLTGGFPCQPFSHAGKRGGTEDDRYLWPEMLRVITELSPEWVIGENVAGLLSMDNGAVMEQVLTDLDGAGYRVEVYVIPAAAVGAPHRRDRVWIVADSQGAVGDRAGDSRRGWTGLTDGGDVGYTDEPRPQGHGQPGERVREQVTGSGSGRQPQPRLGGGASGLPGGLDGHRWPAPLGAPQHEWEPPRVTTRRDNRANRLKALGNAIVPQVAYEIIRHITDQQ